MVKQPESNTPSFPWFWIRYKIASKIHNLGTKSDMGAILVQCWYAYYRGLVRHTDNWYATVLSIDFGLECGTRADTANLVASISKA